MHPSPGLQRKGKFEFKGVSVDLVVQQIAHQAGLVFSSSHVGRLFHISAHGAETHLLSCHYKTWCTHSKSTDYRHSMHTVTHRLKTLIRSLHAEMLMVHEV